MVAEYSPEVRTALEAAGWYPGREYPAQSWADALTREGFHINDNALAIWSEFGGIRVRRESEERPSSFYFDPFDAASGAADEARRLNEDYRENLSPIGLWSSQYRSYIAESGWVMAVGPGWDWELGKNLADMLDLVVIGGAEIKCLKVTHPGARPFPR